MNTHISTSWIRLSGMLMVLAIQFIMMDVTGIARASDWPTAPTVNAKSWILMDARSKQILAESNAEQQLPPASLTKLMTLYLIFEDLKLGRLKADAQVNVSKKAWKIGGSTMFLEPRMKPIVGDLIHGIATLSGNDACIAMAEHIAGSEEAFAGRMNQKAEALGMTHSHFVNASGFPAEGHYSSAKDMAILAAALWRDFPDRYTVFAEREYSYDGRTQPNRNRLLWSMPEADGLKTGHMQEAGFCLVASAEKNNTRFVSAVFGTDSDKERAQQSRVLLTHGFRNFVTLQPAERDIRRKVQVFEGKEDHVWLKPAEQVFVTAPVGMQNNVVFHLQYPAPLHAPIQQDSEIGSVEALLKSSGSDASPLLLNTIPMIAANPVEEASWFGKQWDRVRLMISPPDVVTEQNEVSQ